MALLNCKDFLATVTAEQFQHNSLVIIVHTLIFMINTLKKLKEKFRLDVTSIICRQTGPKTKVTGIKM